MEQQEDEMVQPARQSTVAAEEAAIKLQQASFAWERNQPAVLSNFSLEVGRGQLVIVVGRVGAGKSSLLASLLGELHPRGGSLQVHGSISYTAQEPWIQHCSLMDNILMGLPFDQSRYDEVLQTCALLPDLAVLPAGDQTEIGEKGINLSGGQKHRVALARACYIQSDIALLDDPLSAVDAHVGAHLFRKCICGLLKHRTRILVTHQMQYLSVADWVVVVEAGHISHQGRLEDLMLQDLPITIAPTNTHTLTDNSVNNEAGPTSKALDMPKAAEHADLPETVAGEHQPVLESNTVNDSLPGASEEEQNSKGKLVQAEDRNVGRVTIQTYRIYAKAWGAHYLLPLLMVLLAVGERSFFGLQNWWLSVWSNANAAQDTNLLAQRHTAKFYVMVYALLSVAVMLANVLRTLAAVRGSFNAAKALHEQLLGHVLLLPMAFFDSQPLGRLLNRFTKDTEAVDVELLKLIVEVVDFLASALGSFAIVLFVTPAVLLVAVPLILVYVKVQKLYISTNRELKRLDSTALSPIFSKFSETLSGLATLRAFGKQDHFASQNRALIDESNRAWWPMQVTSRWLAVRVEFISNSVVFTTALMVSAVLPVNAGFAGLAITAAVNLTDNLSVFVRMATKLEVSMNAVERVMEYSNQQPEGSNQGQCMQPPSDWPQSGAIAIKNLQVRYRDDLELVLKGLSFTIDAGEKIGIVGRTGCGKSTLMNTLLRIVEPSGGQVVIDGVDLANVPLHELRSRIALVPQDPVVFSGTVRDNLDPFGSSEGDSPLWAALRQTGMTDTISDLGGLDAVLGEAGSNLSSGQRQLLCMARALLRRAQILMLDEATSNVDSASDALIQQTLHAAFKDCTVLTIAHRLHSVLDSDRVLLLEDGQIKEFDTPQKLLQDQQGAFYTMLYKADSCN